MEELLLAAGEIIFAIIALIFVVYSMIAIYSLNVYGQSKTLAATVSIIYSGIAAFLLVWGWILISQIN